MLLSVFAHESEPRGARGLRALVVQTRPRRVQYSVLIPRFPVTGLGSRPTVTREREESADARARGGEVGGLPVPSPATLDLYL